MAHTINWFEIPSVDFDRAVAFYNTIFDTTLRKEIFNNVPNAIFPADREDVNGAIIHDDTQPSTSGSLVYLNAGDQMDRIVERVEPAGGKVLLPRTSIGDPGFIALFLDTEGNKVGLHSPA